MRWGHVARVEKMRNTYKILIEKSEWERLLEIQWRRLDDNIKMDLKEMWLDGVDWIGLAKYSEWKRINVNTLIILRVA
jgi:hypothetical protein